jgi:hypothetical protein
VFPGGVGVLGNAMRRPRGRLRLPAGVKAPGPAAPITRDKTHHHLSAVPLQRPDPPLDLQRESMVGGTRLAVSRRVACLFVASCVAVGLAAGFLPCRSGGVCMRPPVLAFFSILLTRAPRGHPQIHPAAAALMNVL